MTKAQEIIKEAKIFGGVEKEHYMSYAPAVPFEDKLDMYKQYVQDKSKDTKTSWSSAIIKPAVGLGIAGSLIGGLTIPLRLMKGVGIGAGIGAGIGTVLGAVSKAIDDNEISEAIRIVNSSNMTQEVKKALIKELESDFEYRENREAYRHNQMMRELRKK